MHALDARRARSHLEVVHITHHLAIKGPLVDNLGLHVLLYRMLRLVGIKASLSWCAKSVRLPGVVKVTQVALVAEPTIFFSAKGAVLTEVRVLTKQALTVKLLVVCALLAGIDKLRPQLYNFICHEVYDGSVTALHLAHGHRLDTPENLRADSGQAILWKKIEAFLGARISVLKRRSEPLIFPLASLMNLHGFVVE